MVQIPKFTNKNLSQRTSGVPFNIPNVSDAATLPFRALAKEADKATDIASNFKKIKVDQQIAIDKINNQQKIKEYQLDEQYKTDVFKLNETLDSDFKTAQLTLNRKTEVKSIYHSILPEINQLKIDIANNTDTKNSANNWEQTSKKIYSKAIKNIDDQVVKQLFTMKFNDLIAAEGIEVQSTIRKTDISNAISIHKIEKEQLYNDYLNYKPGHPKREAAWERLFGADEDNPNIFIEAAQDLILTDLPHIAILKAQQELYTMEAKQMVDQNPHQFLELLKNDYWKTRLDPATITSLIDPAIDNARAMDVDTLVSFMPLDPNQSFEEAEVLYKEAKSGNFHDNEELQGIYQNLDKEGLADFNKTLDQQRSNVRAEINFQQGQVITQEIAANDELYQDTYEKITSGELGINDIDALPFEGKLGVQYKESLKKLIVSREEGTMPSDAGLQLYDQAFKMIMNGEINSVTDKVMLGDKVQSIMDITNKDGIGFRQNQNLYNLILNKNNKDYTYQAAAFQDFLTSYEDQILGNPVYQKFNTKSQSRFFDFSLIMKEAYDKGIKEGKTVSNLLQSTSPDFILKNIAAFIPTNEILTKEILESMNVGLVTEDNAPPPRKQGQTITEWHNTPEYIEWKSNQ
tara:strand:- start:5016 stop:6908 length:1893 start_codon:yes stop_codon:yes gene_type:complete